MIDRKSDFATGESHQDIQIPETPAEPFLLQGDGKEDEYWLREEVEKRAVLLAYLQQHGAELRARQSKDMVAALVRIDWPPAPRLRRVLPPALHLDAGSR